MLNITVSWKTKKKTKKTTKWCFKGYPVGLCSSFEELNAGPECIPRRSQLSRERHVDSALGVLTFQDDHKLAGGPFLHTRHLHSEVNGNERQSSRPETRVERKGSLSFEHAPEPHQGSLWQPKTERLSNARLWLLANPVTLVKMWLDIFAPSWALLGR